MKNLIKINLILIVTIFFTNCKKESIDPVVVNNNTTIIDTTKKPIDTLQSVKDSLLYVNLKSNSSNEYIKVIFHDTVYEFFANKYNIFLNSNNSSGLGNSCFIPLGTSDTYIFINGIKKSTREFITYPVYGIEMYLIMQGKISEITLNKKYTTHRGSSSYNTFNATLVYGRTVYSDNNGVTGYSGIRNIKTNDTTDNYNIITKIIDANELYQNKSKFIVSGHTKMTIAVNHVETKLLYDNQSIEIFYNNLKLYYYKDNSVDKPGVYNGTINEQCDKCW